jgi:2-polyprenyl-6-methoxyphenol hydroxylase-like FAD-dependent oxidoreductase
LEGEELGKQSAEIVVVGAGPVGFLTALGLARAGNRVTIIEAEAAINSSPRAAVYLPVTLEFLHKLGIFADAFDVGLQSDALSMHVRETGECVELHASVLKDDTAFPFQLHFGQDVLAGIVHRRLLELPDTAVHFNTRLTAIEQDDSGVTISVETQEGPGSMRCDWLVGADGGRSGVRKALNLPFEGHTWPERFVATNIWYEEFAEHGIGYANFMTDPVRWAVIAAISRDNLWRVTYNEDGSIPDEEALRRVPERLKELLPGSKRYELAAASPYRVHERASPRFRVGRVLLAGDAAHVCNPCGGMGLTTGVMDANALIDALSAVIDGRAGESILDFYGADRLRVFREFSSPAATEYKRILGESDPERRRRDLEQFKTVASNPAIMRQTMLAIFAVRGNPMPVPS